MRYFFLLSLTFILSSCKISPPTFKYLGVWKVSQVNAQQVTLMSSATFHNPNNITGLKVNTVNLVVETGGKYLGKINTNESGVNIPKLADFEIPINITVNLADLIGNLGSVIGIITGQTIDIRCRGDIKVGYMIINKSVAIDQTLPLSIKDVKK